MQNILIGLGLVAAVGGGVYVYTSSNTEVSEEAMEASGSVNEEARSSRDFAAIMTAGENVECTVTHEDNGNRTEGTIYIADQGERIRGHFIITGTMNTEMHLIRNDGTNYLWGSAFPQGIKVAVTAENQDTLFEGDASATIPDNVSFTCNSWRVDDSRFIVPNDVTFLDMQAQMDAIMQGMSGGGSAGFEGGADMKAMQCGTCDQAGSARAQCRAALGCDS